ncbi:MAG: hypothetical protein IJL32_00325, partial [Oscillospiraceae bacterium]|nr:hypothetical protein [Oscillospiraceae bacterium]
MKKTQIITSGLSAALVIIYLTTFSAGIASATNWETCGFASYSISDVEKITDLETIREMFTKFIEENTLNARCVSSDLYPDYAKTVVIEWNAGTT